MSSTNPHFENKTVYEHVKEARNKGLYASMETHGVEMPGRYAAGLDSAKDTAITLQLLFVVMSALSLSLGQIFLGTFLFSIGWLIWKTGRSALLGWSRLERLHRLIEEERWEIEHHRAQEREELTVLYQMKGFKGKLLEEVIDVLMADDNRLLQVMLEEELGLQLEVYEHPLKQSLGAAIGVLVSSGIFFLALCIPVFYATYLASFIIIASCCYFEAKKQKNEVPSAIIWTIAISALALSIAYLISKVHL